MLTARSESRIIHEDLVGKYDEYEESRKIGEEDNGGIKRFRISWFKLLKGRVCSTCSVAEPTQRTLKTPQPKDNRTSPYATIPSVDSQSSVDARKHILAMLLGLQIGSASSAAVARIHSAPIKAPLPVFTSSPWVMNPASLAKAPPVGLSISHFAEIRAVPQALHAEKLLVCTTQGVAPGLHASHRVCICPRKRSAGIITTPSKVPETVSTATAVPETGTSSSCAAALIAVAAAPGAAAGATQSSTAVQGVPVLPLTGVPSVSVASVPLGSARVAPAPVANAAASGSSRVGPAPATSAAPGSSTVNPAPSARGALPHAIPAALVTNVPPRGSAHAPAPPPPPRPPPPLQAFTINPPIINANENSRRVENVQAATLVLPENDPFNEDITLEQVQAELAFLRSQQIPPLDTAVFDVPDVTRRPPAVQQPAQQRAPQPQPTLMNQPRVAQPQLQAVPPQPQVIQPPPQILPRQPQAVAERPPAIGQTRVVLPQPSLAQQQQATQQAQAAPKAQAALPTPTPQPTQILQRVQVPQQAQAARQPLVTRPAVQAVPQAPPLIAVLQQQQAAVAPVTQHAPAVTQQPQQAPAAAPLPTRMAQFMQAAQLPARPVPAVVAVQQSQSAVGPTPQVR